MIRLLLVLFTLVGFLIFSYPFLVAQVSLGKKDPHARDLETIKVVRSVFKVLLKLAGVTVTVKGAENIPEDTAVLYVGNHRSYFDILAGYTTVPTLLGFVAKKEMEKIPLLRTWMVNVNCLFLDRKNIKEGLKTILQGIEKVKNGVSIWIFPEGTRSKTGALGKFKSGAVLVASKTGGDVIPCCIKFEGKLHFRSRVTVIFGKVIKNEEFEIKELTPGELRNASRLLQSRVEELYEDKEREQTQ